MLPLFIEVNTFTLILLSVASAALAVFEMNPALGVFYCIVQYGPRDKAGPVEYLGFKDMTLNIGRASGIILVLLMADMPNGYVWSIFILTIMQFGLLIVTKVCEKRVQQYMPH